MALDVYFETRQEKSEYPRLIASASSFDFLEKTNIQCHRRLVEEMRIMDIEAMKREAIENQESTQIQPGRAYPSEVPAVGAGTTKPSQEVAPFAFHPAAL